MAVPDIFDEVDEDLRAERIRTLLRRYGGVLLALIAVLVLAVAGWQAWKWQQARRVARTAEQFAAALKLAGGHPGPDRQAAVPLFAAIARDGANDAYRALARLQQAALLAQAGDLKGASALWDQVQADPNADKLLRDVAGLQWAQQQLDSGDPARVAARLAPLATPDSPFHGLAQEAQAMLELRQGHDAAARETLTRLSHDPTVPQDLRQRGADLLAQLPPAPQAASAKPAAGRGGS